MESTYSKTLCGCDIAVKILTLIPARSGSKRLAGKNIRLLAGKPLLAYTIEAALQSRYVDREDVVVCTDSPEIAYIAEKYGANCPFLEPGWLPRGVPHAVMHVLDRLKERDYDYVLTLQPTSPLRTSAHIDDTVDLMKTCSPQVSGIVSVSESQYDLKLACAVNEDGHLIRATETEGTCLWPNGAIYLIRKNVLLEQKTFIPANSMPYIMSREASVDIDELVDFVTAEHLMTMGDIQCTR